MSKCTQLLITVPVRESTNAGLRTGFPNEVNAERQMLVGLVILVYWITFAVSFG